MGSNSNYLTNSSNYNSLLSSYKSKDKSLAERYHTFFSGPNNTDEIPILPDSFYDGIDDKGNECNELCNRIDYKIDKFVDLIYKLQIVRSVTRVRIRQIISLTGEVESHSLSAKSNQYLLGMGSGGGG